MSYITISKCNAEHDNYPCWIPVVDSDGNRVRPNIRCKCGSYCGIGLHHVHPDGTVTASFYHQKKEGQTKPHIGCEWHVFIKLADYDWGEYLPEKPKN